MAVTSAEENERIVREHFDRMWNHGEFDTDVLADDYHAVLNGGAYHEWNLDEMQGVVAEWREAFPDLHKEIDETTATDERVVIRYTFTGTHEGEILEIPPTGNEVEIPVIGICYIENGKITKEWYVADFLRLMHQLGVVQPPAE